MSIYAPATDYYWEALQAAGANPRPVFERAGVAPELRYSVTDRISHEQYHGLIAAAVEATGDPAFTVRATSHLHPSHLGLLGYAWISSMSLRAALQKLQRYLRLVSTVVDMEVEVRGSAAHVRFLRSKEAQIHVAQRYGVLAVLVRLIRMIVGESFNPISVSFAAAAPENREPFDSHFRCPLKFDAGSDEVVIPVQDLDRNLPRAHPILAESTDEHIVAYLKDLQARDIIGRVRAELAQLLEQGEASMENVAAQLDMDSQKLKRELAAEGTTYRKVLEGLRKDRTLRLLRNAALPITTISYTLGFSEPSVFTRFCIKHFDLPPTRLRIELLSGKNIAFSNER